VLRARGGRGEQSAGESQAGKKVAHR
jgi:hypothetical protein